MSVRPARGFRYYLAYAGAFAGCGLGLLLIGRSHLYGPEPWAAASAFIIALLLAYRLDRRMLASAGGKPRSLGYFVVQGAILAAIFAAALLYLSGKVFYDITSIHDVPIGISLVLTGLLAFVPRIFAGRPEPGADVSADAPAQPPGGGVIEFLMQYLAFAAPLAVVGYALMKSGADVDYQGQEWHAAPIVFAALLVGAVLDGFRFRVMEGRRGLGRPGSYALLAGLVLAAVYAAVYVFVHTRLYPDVDDTYYNIGESMLRTGALAFLPGLLLGSMTRPASPKSPGT